METSYPPSISLSDPNFGKFSEEAVREILPLLKDRNVEDIPLSVLYQRTLFPK